MKLPPYIDPSAFDSVQAPSKSRRCLEGKVEGDHNRRDGERKRIVLEAVEAEHKEAEGYTE